MVKYAMPYEWPKGYTSAAVFSADVDGESPWIWCNRGQKTDKLGEVEQRRFGPRVGLSRILGLCEEFGIKGSFYVPGWIAATYPELLPAIARGGHEAGAHGYYHERVDELGEAENDKILRHSIRVFRQQLGKAPVGYRSPSWELTPTVHRCLRKHRFLYDSSLMGMDHPYSLDGLPEIPVQWFVDDAPYFRYVGGPTDKTPPANPMSVLEGWLEEFEATREFGGLFMITIHPWISGRGQRVRMLRRLLDTVVNTRGVWVTTAEEVARWHAKSPNARRFAMKLKIPSTGTALE
jgi:peptidoglycan/xylan/chitin deacetylase (PgdA/CDA1 family)